MKPDGVYLVEDLATNYWEDFITYPGGLTFVELAGKLVHRLNDAYRAGPGCLNRFSASISGASTKVRLPSGGAAA